MPNDEEKRNISKIINNFLNSRFSDMEILAVFLTGSFASEKNNPGSDIDLQIVVSDRYKTRERGGIFIDGFLIDYRVNPRNQIKKYFEIDSKQNDPLMCIAILEGKIFFEKNKVGFKLKQIANKKLKKKYTILSESRVIFKKYLLAEMLRKINSIYSKRRCDMGFVYFSSLKSVYETYASFMQQPILRESMLFDYFRGNCRFGSVLADFPDNVFASLFLSAIKANGRSRQMAAYKEITEYAIKKMGGFNDREWVLEIPVDYSNKMDVKSRIF